MDKSKLPPENRSLRAPDPKDYPGFYEETDEGEVATLHYFVDAMYYLEATGDPSAVNLVTDDSQCSACVEARDSAVEATSSGNYKSQRRAQILSTNYVRTDEEAGAYLEYTVTPGAVLTGDNAGQEIEGAQFATVSSATWSDGHWKLTAIASRRLDR
ncbi:DUF6318 family protein [Helcobacillus massiliensis]|uniref:DUF6318 family protein n=1 Tax=Helcobacillus massiliensis TaxID=521392 RepID=UPI00255690A3|nr:DUF6318 family protein [Helcobacillus massiliensis]MDK7742931.1 DUF6318 family protein [Helcobacillus massiliensis]WOO92076.1 DUF6318 family protein [Helcobacillus massiliensis]